MPPGEWLATSRAISECCDRSGTKDSKDMSATVDTSKYLIQGSAGAPTVWVRKNSDGEIYTHEQTQEERMQHIVPPAGEYRLRLISFAEPFEMQSEMYGKSINTRLELQIVGGRGDGKTLTLLTTWMIGPRSNLGKVYKAITGRPVDRGIEYDPTEMLGGEFRALLYPSENLDENNKPRGTKCTWDSVKPVGATSDGDDWN